MPKCRSTRKQMPRTTHNAQRTISVSHISHRLLLRRAGRSSRSILLSRLVLARVRHLILQNLDELVESDGHNGASSWPNPCFL